MNTQGTPSVIPRAHRRRPTLTITAGPLSSGKSAWVRSFRGAEGEPLCLIRDEVRSEIGGAGYLIGPVDADIEESVSARIKEDVARALSAGVDVYLDGCNNHPRTRTHWESLATENSAGFRAMLFNLPLEQITALNAQRAAPHPHEKIASSHRFWAEQFQKMAHRPQHLFINGERTPVRSA